MVCSAQAGEDEEKDDSLTYLDVRYFSLTVKGKKHENLIWYYPYPTHESAGVQGLISFYNKENVEILIDGIEES